MNNQKAYQKALSAVKNCYLCGKEQIKVVGCYVPSSPSQLLGEPVSGKTRTYWYGLCEKCFKLTNKEKLVEEKMKSELEAGMYFKIYHK
mgnify:CR=1 FL=1